MFARRAAAVVVLALAAALAAPEAHAAKKRIVVLDFTGPKASRFQAAVTKLVKKNARIVTQKQFTRAAKKVKRFKANADGVSKVARQLDAHGVLSGKVTRKRGKYRLILMVREGRTGEFVGDDIVITTRAPRLTRAHERKISRELRAILRDLPDPNEEEVAEEEPEEDLEEEVAEADERDDSERDDSERDDSDDSDDTDDADDEERQRDPPARGKGKRTADASGGDDDDEDGGAADVKLSASQRADLDARGRAIDLTAGLSVMSRSLSFTFDPGQATTPQGYDGAMVPGLYVSGELYPMALMNRSATGVTRHIGISAVLDKVLLIKSKPVDQDVDLPTSQTRFGVGLVYRWNFGDRPTSPTLKIGARYNKLSFTVDETAAPMATITLPDVSYTYIDPGVGFRYPVTAKIAATADARYLVVTAAGPISDQAQYGAGTASGYDVELGGEYKLGSTLAIRAGFRILRIGLTFDGSGDLADRNDDMTQDVQSASDRYLGFHASAGWLF